MYLFLVPLLLGFAANLASAFTATFSRWWGKRGGTLASSLLRNVLGIPVWAVGFLLAVRTRSPALFVSTPMTTALGWLIVAAGGAIILAALITLRWRAVKPSTGDALATTGLYSRVRHPIHSGTLLEFAGLLLLMPALTMTVACILGIIWVIVQTKLEEIDLLQRLPDYRAYMNRVPRFLPRVRMR